ncbi:hypothetical protein CNMCM7691_008799 [Aspergillus felis]|uniref:NACHT domain-containing protein n=1 Tax=Aspergillus felis TaxID=1287682 RepID=A0A8H6QVY3_9EURO|nr:hypothetical protein CNMCM7691_008799 [Aspergillus felis]
MPRCWFTFGSRKDKKPVENAARDEKPSASSNGSFEKQQTGANGREDQATKKPEAAAHGAPELTTSQILWNEAYDTLKVEEAALVRSYMKVITKNLQPEGSTRAAAGVLVEMDDPVERELLMQKLVREGLQKIETASEVAKGVGVVADVFLKAKGLIDTAIGNIPQAALPWAGVCVVLQPRAGPHKSDASLAVEPGRHGQYIKVGEDNYEGVRDQLKSMLVKLYKALLLYQMKSVCSYYRNQVGEFLRQMLNLQDWDAALEDVRKAETAVENYLKQFTTLQMRDMTGKIVGDGEERNELLSGMRQDIRQQNNDQKKMHLDDETAKCLRDFDAVDPQSEMADIEARKDTLLKEAYEWVLRTEQHAAWTNWDVHDPCRLLWINGPAGTGKTMPLIGIIRELEKQLGANLTYFFCQSASQNLRDATSALKSLIWLLLQRQPQLTSHLLAKYRSGSRFNDVQAFWTLKRVFLEMLADPSLSPIYVIVDALDECDVETPGREHLIDLISESLSVTDKIRWLVSSRPEVHVYEKLKGAGHARNNPLAKRPGYTPKIQEEISREIRQRAMNTFLWVALVFKELQNTPGLYAMRKVKKCPNDLLKLFDHLMNQIERGQDEDPMYCRSVLAAVCLAYRPLSFDELHVIAGLDPDDIAGRIVKECGSFLTVQEKTVSLVHLSAREWLMSNFESRLQKCGPAQVHAHIWQRSIAGMSVEESGLKRNICDIEEGTQSDDVVIPNPDPLAALRYSCEFWIDHLLEDGQISDENCHLFADDEEIFSFLKSISSKVPKLVSFLNDAEKFVRRHRTAIEQTPLQTHGTALALSPTKSDIRNMFWKDRLSFIESVQGVSDAWDACLQILGCSTIPNPPVAFSPDGKVLVSAISGRVQLWDLPTGGCKRVLEEDDEVWQVAFSPDGNTLITIAGSAVCFWDVTTEACKKTLNFPDGSVSASAFLIDGAFLAVASGRGIRLWDTARMVCTKTIEDVADDQVKCIALSPDGRLLVTRIDRVVQVWDIAAGTVTQEIPESPEFILSAAFSPDSKTLALGLRNQKAMLWDIESAAFTYKPDKDNFRPFDAFTADGRFVRAGGGDVQSISRSPDANYLVSVARDGTVKLWDRSMCEAEQTSTGLGAPIQSVASSPDDTVLLWVSAINTMQLWTADGVCTHTLTHPTKMIRSVAFSPDGKIFASGAEEDTVCLWDVATGSRLRILKHGGKCIFRLVFSSDGSTLAAEAMNTLQLWDLATGSSTHSFNHFSIANFSPDGKFLAALPSPRKILASLSIPRKVLLLNTATGFHQTLDNPHPNPIFKAAFSPDGKILASASAGGILSLWDTATGTCTQTSKFGTYVTNLSFSDDGKFLLTDGARFSLDDGSVSPQPPASDEGLATDWLRYDGEWVSREGKNLLYIPADIPLITQSQLGPLIIAEAYYIPSRYELTIHSQPLVGAMSAQANQMGPSAAHALVKQISKQHGYLGEEVLSQMVPDVRREVEEALLMKDAMIGSSVITLAKNLYNSTARFVFELLQNADDNSYNIAKSTSTDPFVSFCVYNRRIVVECNEDGFTHENLVAICNVGKSSKMGTQGYIGEKGIGFKSVFMVAWKVHIQSRDLSFSFRHKMEDSGMGMITPVWEESEEVLPHPLTRITLFLHETGAAEDLARQRETTLQQLRELKATFLLFMKNLRRIEIKMCDSLDKAVSHTTFSMQYLDESRVALKQEIVQDGELQECTQYYHTAKLTAWNIPKSENREYTDVELSKKAYSETSIVLAFPVTHDSVPIIEPQEVFAFLPIRNMGLPFLIQADFVTDASRQDIVRSSARNMKLLPAIAQAFIQAVKQFCTHTGLAYQWMRYLPEIDWGSQDGFWKALPGEICRQLQLPSTMWTRSQRNMRCIGDMRLIPGSMCDKYGRPLLPDLETEQYLSSYYAPKDLISLRAYGLQLMNRWEFLDRLRQDVNNGDSSIMRNPDTTDDWHSAVAKYLISVSGPKYQMTWEMIKNIGLIPLMGGRWTFPSFLDTYPVYFTQTHGYVLPTDGIFDLIAPNAEMNPARKQLFALLGVQEASLRDIRRKIIDQDTLLFPGLETSRSHLHFLYLTAHLDREHDQPTTYSLLKLTDNASRLKSRLDGTWYFPDEEPYSPQKLLAQFDPTPSILHPHYMCDCPEKPGEETRSWRAWLNEMFGIRNVIPLTSNKHLSEECLYLAKSCPEKFLPFLLKYWPFEGAYIADNPDLVKALLNIEVLCENSRVYPLGKTYVRTAQLAYADGFLREGEFFPWLKLDLSDEAPGFSDIRVLTTALGFGRPKSELEFYLTILQFVSDGNRGKKKVLDDSRIFDLYSRIANRYHESVTLEISREMIVSAFKAQRLIYVPGYDSAEASWALPHECLWEAPGYMQSTYPLKSQYHDIPKGKHIGDLFQSILDIKNAGIDDFLLELEWTQDADYVDYGLVSDLYQELDKRRSRMDDATVKKIRERFEKDELIYHESDDGETWYSPSECLWSTVTDIKGMIALSDVYEDLAGFFTELIGVRTLTLQMVHDKLVEQGSGDLSAEEVKQTIWLLNSYMQNENDLPDPRRVLTAKVFPVRYPTGSVELCSSAVDFAIADRKHLLDSFSNKAKFLDFNVNEIARLEPFLQWTGLDRRYLSSLVKEISTVRGDSHSSRTSSDRNIARKAYGLLRIAVHFRSPRLKAGEQSLYEMLRNIGIRETDGISSELHLNQDGKDIMVEISQSELHFQEYESGLTIYVPRNEKAQYLCFLDRIPRALMEWIMTEPSTGICEPFTDKALNVLSKVLQAETMYIGTTLDRAGIMSVETPDDSAADEVADNTEDELTERHTEGRDSTDDATLAGALMGSARGESSVALADDFSSAPYAGPSTPSRVSSRVPFTPRGTVDDTSYLSPGHGFPAQLFETVYVTILRSVVNNARTSTFPSRGSFNMTALAQSLDPGNESFQLRGIDKLYRDKLIGAAGELFVFETLCRLSPSLPRFGRDNWQSTIRHYVNLHEDYADLEPWNGRETADITYSDREGILTSLLIDKGYLDATWTRARPHYFLEVKTTTSSWDTPFYMSKYQYERMRAMRHGDTDSDNQASVYVIFRVYNLGRDSVGMKVYVNPGLMEVRGELVFVTETWSVVPGSVSGVAT